MSKYSNRKVFHGDETFDSQWEYDRYVELRFLETAGQIRNLECQVPVKLGIHYDNGREAVLIVDFRYFDEIEGDWVWEDTKGFETPASKLKRAIARKLGICVQLRKRDESQNRSSRRTQGKRHQKQGYRLSSRRVRAHRVQLPEKG